MALKVTRVLISTLQTQPGEVECSVVLYRCSLHDTTYTKQKTDGKQEIKFCAVHGCTVDCLFEGVGAAVCCLRPAMAQLDLDDHRPSTINHQLVFTKSGVVGWGTTKSIAEVKKVDPPWRIHQKCFTNYLFSLKRSQENWTMLLLMSKIDLKSLSEIKLVFWKRFLSGETENARGSKRERQRESKEKVSNTQQIQKTVLT